MAQPVSVEVVQPSPKRIGRPPKEINWEQFEQLCALQCTQQEIADFFHIHNETLTIKVELEYNLPYPDIYRRYSNSGKVSLRRTQFNLAKKSAQMAIRLGQLYLDQVIIEENQTMSPDHVTKLMMVMNQMTKMQDEAVKKDLENGRDSTDRPTEASNEGAGTSNMEVSEGK